MDKEYIEQVRRNYLEMQQNRAKEILHLLEGDDEFLDSGSARVEDYPGRRKPLHPEEDFYGYIALTHKLFIYKDVYGEIVIPFSQIIRIKIELSRLEGTSGIAVKMDDMNPYFTANTPFANDFGKGFKSGFWSSQLVNPKSRLQKIFGR